MNRGRIVPSVIISLCLAEMACGLATEQVGPPRSDRPTVEQPGWPKGAIDVARHDSRVYSRWVNGNEHFYFWADPNQLNELLASFAGIDMGEYEVWLRSQDGRTETLLDLDEHPVFTKSGRARAKTFGGDQIDYNVDFFLPSGIYLWHVREQQEWENARPQLTIHIEHDKVSWSQLKIPDNVALKDAGEIKIIGPRRRSEYREFALNRTHDIGLFYPLTGVDGKTTYPVAIETAEFKQVGDNLHCLVKTVEVPTAGAAFEARVQIVGAIGEGKKTFPLAARKNYDLGFGPADNFVEAKNFAVSIERTEPWGQEVDGIQVRVIADRQFFTDDEVVSLSADIRNRGAKEFLIAQHESSFEAAVDGRWHRWEGELGLKSSPLSPAREYHDIPIALDKTHWINVENKQPLMLGPGTHNIQARALLRARENYEVVSTVESNPVSISVKEKTAKVRSVFYGRVELGDASPEKTLGGGLKTYIIKWDEGAPAPTKVTEVERDGSFAVGFSDQDLSSLKSNKSRLTLNVVKFMLENTVHAEPLPFEILVSDPNKAPVITINLPLYYGRVLYEDGTPAVLDSIPWPGARIRVDLKGESEIDSEGYFQVYLTEKQRKGLEAGNLDDRGYVYFPYFEKRNSSRSVARFPANLLSPDKSKAGVVKIAKPVYKPQVDLAKAPSLVGKPLPALDRINIEFAPQTAEGKSILVCFFDMNQRPSRHLVTQLARRADELRQKHVTVIAIQTSKVEDTELRKWAEKTNISFPLGTIEGSVDETRFNWGAKSLPWLILTDREHVVFAEGFGIEELDEKIKSSNGKAAEAPESSEAEDSNKPAFSTTLANGVTVDLVGLCEHPSEGKRWWRADGSLLEESPYDDDFGRAFPKDGEKGYKFAVKFSGMAGKDVDVDIEPTDFKTTNGGRLFCTSKKNSKENTKYVEGSLDEKIVWLGAAFDEELGHCDIKIGVCDGDWKDHYRYETDQPGDAVEWVEFRNVSLRAGVKTDLQVGGRQLAGGPLPKLDGLGVKINSKETKEKRVLVCFFDMNQRPSRHYIMELTKRAEELKEEGIAVVCIQASSVEQQKLDDWISKHSMAFSVGMIEANEEKVRFKWGVRSLPWLILTDAAHVVRADGFGLEELDERVKNLSNVTEAKTEAAKSPQVVCSGKVVDPSGEPLPGANVGAYEIALDRAGNIKLKSIAQATTEADGAFVFASEHGRSHRSLGGLVVANKTGLALGWTNWELDGRVEVTIQLSEPNKLEGLVVDEADEPIAAAEIRAILFKKHLSANQKREWLPGIAPLQCLAVKTDNNGRFVFDNIPSDTHVDLLAKAGGRATITTHMAGMKPLYAAGQTNIRLLLPPEGRIQGKVIDRSNGKGISGAPLTVLREPSESFFDRLVCASEEDGTFSIGGLRPGRYAILGVSTSPTVRTESGKTTDEVILECPTVVRGRVTDPYGGPIANEEVQFRSEEKVDGRCIGNVNAETNEQGYYQCLHVDWPFRVGFLWHENLPSGEGLRHQYLRQKRVLEGSQTVDFQFNQFPKGSAELRARVVDELGRRVEGFHVDVRNKVDWKDYSEDLYQYGYKLSFKKSDGRFKVANLPAALYRLSVFPETGYESHSSEILLEDVKLTNVTVEVVKKPVDEATGVEKTTYYGRLLFEDGAPAVPYFPPWPGAKVSVHGSDVDNEGYFTAYLTDEQVEQIKAGEVKMHISYPSYEDQYTGRTVGTFPPELLSPDRDKAGAYRLFRPRKRRARPGYFTSLIDKMLPKLDGIGIEFNAERARNKMVLVCFADVYQRPSRHCVRELTRRAEELKEEGVVVVCVQGSKTDQQELNDWIKKNEVAFPVGMIEGDEEEVRSKWGVKSLPWLILTDRNHIVTAEGFGIEELEGRIEHAAPRSGQPQSTEISPHEILKQYEHGLSAFTQVCAIDVESSVVVKENGVETRRFIILYEYRRDNDRFDVNCVECGVDDEGNRIEDSAWRRRAICDGNGHAIFYYGPSAIPQEVEYTFDGSKQLGFTRAQMGTGLSLDGYLARDQVSVIKLLSNSADLRLREATEKVDGFECCVLEASTSHGSYTLWLDPQHGYLARKAVVKKQNADIFDHKPLTEIDWLAGISFTMNSVRIERRGGVFVPVGSRNTEVWHKSDGQTETRVHHHRRTRIDLEPDFAALGAFAPNIPDGTEVVVGVQGIAVKYIWKQGKVVDSEGRDVALTAGEPLSLVGKGLPDFEGTGVDFDLKRAEGKRVLVCFFDMNQRPSRHCVMELTKRAEELKEKSIDAICVQASRVEQQKLDDWVRKNHVPFSMGMIQKNEEQNRFTWGVKSLPWLILADKEHIVRAEGLQLEQLNEKIKESNDADY